MPPGKPPSKPPTGKAGALPDAALLDDDGAEDGEAAVAANPTGFRRFLPTSPLGWAIAASVVVALISGATTAAIFLTPAKAPPSVANIVGPAQVINGRTLVVAGRTIRLQAIDAPPATLVCRDGNWEYKCGADSRKALEQLVGSRPVDCEPVHTDDGVVHALCHSEQGIDVAAALVSSGWAVADLRRSSRYFPQQTKAQDEGLGLWRNNFAYPEQWRLVARETAK